MYTLKPLMIKRKRKPCTSSRLPTFRHFIWVLCFQLIAPCTVIIFFKDWRTFSFVCGIICLLFLGHNFWSTLLSKKLKMANDNGEKKMTMTTIFLNSCFLSLLLKMSSSIMVNSQCILGVKHNITSNLIEHVCAIYWDISLFSSTSVSISTIKNQCRLLYCLHLFISFTHLLFRLKQGYFFCPMDPSERGFVSSNKQTINFELKCH